jgi:DNA-binding NarL/FixJ family response regulator
MNGERILIVAREDCLLRSALTHLLRDGDERAVQCVPRLDQIERIAGGFRLIIIFTDFSLRNLSHKSRLLLESGQKVLLVLRSNCQHSFRYIKGLNFYGIISETSNYEELKVAINLITAKNSRYISPALLPLMIGEAATDSFFKLTKAEMEIAEFVLAGRKNKEIAGALKISEKTVSTHKTRIFKKLDVASDVDLLKLSQESWTWVNTAIKESL